MRILHIIWITILLGFSVSQFAFSQESRKSSKPTRAERKAKKAEVRQEKEARKAELRGKKRHYQIQDKKTRKRMKKHRRKVDKHFPGKPQSFLRQDEKSFFVTAL
jgi:Flp pilus assembly protein TadB